MKEIETLKQICTKYWRIVEMICKSGFRQYKHQRYCEMADRAYISELRKHGWERKESHAFSKTGQRYFDGYIFHHENGTTIKQSELIKN